MRSAVGQLAFGAVVLAGAWTMGSAVRSMRAQSERAALQLADRAVTDERLRIARELHDVVAHSMGLIAVKAGVANHVLSARPDEARDAGARRQPRRRADGYPDARTRRDSGHQGGLLRHQRAGAALTMFDLDEFVYAALRAGASGFLLKDTPPADVLTAIRVIAAGDALLAPGITRRLIAEFSRRRPVRRCHRAVWMG